MVSCKMWSGKDVLCLDRRMHQYPTDGYLEGGDHDIEHPQQRPVMTITITMKRKRRKKMMMMMTTTMMTTRMRMHDIREASTSVCAF